jgi:mRNA interferase MazF
VSRGAAYDVKSSVTVIEVSTTLRGIDSEVPLGARDGLPKKCVANADNVVTIPKIWLAERVCALRADKLRAVDRALAFSLGL